MCYFSVSGTLFLLETMSRSAALTQAASDYPLNETTHLLPHIDNIESPHQQLIHTPNKMRLEVGERKIEVSELCDLHLDKLGRAAYTVCICVYMYSALWIYGAIFSSSLSAHFPLTMAVSDSSTHDAVVNNSSYYLYLLLFATFCIPISCMELSEQITLQVILSCCRILMIILMLTTITVAIITKTTPFSDFHHVNMQSNDFISFSTNSNHFNKLYTLLPIAAYANVYHHSLPALSHFTADKQLLGTIFSCTVIFCSIAYMLIGSVISSYFGEFTKSPSNLNWTNYIGHNNSDGNDGTIPLYARCISTYIVCFPAVDAASAFPLSSITLGNNLLSSFYGKESIIYEKSRMTRYYFKKGKRKLKLLLLLLLLLMNYNCLLSFIVC